jgi:hypothetical protein
MKLTDAEGALQQIVDVIESAGALNLSNGVQLGATSWYVKMTDALDYAHKTLGDRQPAQPEAQPTYEDVGMADANAAEQFAVCYVAKVGVSKETMIDAISTLQAIILRLRGRLVAQPEAQPVWRKCSQCKREFSLQSWQKNDGKCPNCDDIFDKEDREASEFAAMANEGGFEAQPAPDVVEQQVTAILQAVVKETNEQWEAAAEKVARVREGK